MPKTIDTPITTALSDDGVTVSGGEAQKIAIARAWYKDAPIMILDEPTAALDPISEYEIYQRFDELIEGKTAIYVSHRMSSTRFSQRIVVLITARLFRTVLTTASWQNPVFIAIYSMRRRNTTPKIASKRLVKKWQRQQLQWRIRQLILTSPRRHTMKNLGMVCLLLFLKF